MSGKAVQESALAGRSVAHATLPATSYSPVLGACLKSVADCIARSGQRRALRELAQEERLLSDIGLTHEQALREADKPFWRR
jgi:uncharacterized protein YjiS (DUF1127 family)